jgi:hypothetical protein
LASGKAIAKLPLVTIMPPEFGSVVNAVQCEIVIQETRLSYCINGVAMKVQPE